jgi:hypothetical protein
LFVFITANTNQKIKADWKRDKNKTFSCHATNLETKIQWYTGNHLHQANIATCFYTPE